MDNTEANEILKKKEIEKEIMLEKLDLADRVFLSAIKELNEKTELSYQEFEKEFKKRSKTFNRNMIVVGIVWGIYLGMEIYKIFFTAS